MNMWPSLSAADVWALLVQQCLQLTVLIVCILGLVRLVAKNRPHLAHALWGLVLLKCLTPPIVALPLSPFCMLQSARESRVTMSITSRPNPQEGTLTASDLDQMSTLPQFTLTPSPASSRQPSTEASPAWFAPLPTTLTDTTIDANLKPKRVPTKNLWQPSLRWAVGAWAISAGMCLLIAAVRLAVFLRNIRHTSIVPKSSTQQMLDQLLADLPQRRFLLRGCVRVVVVDSLIGPAVVGLLRPRILLPRVLESECSASELRILLAHELTHIRRGDLWWALLQTAACCLWWFHPLVHFVSRWFDRVTELSCDEETVASLHCQPVEYARSLLSVLERKHLLHSAPALPGVRPVELTAKRMEQIMKLTNNAKAHRPWWVVLVLLIGAACVLPGAALSVADDLDTLESTKDLTAEVRQAAADEPPPGIAASAPATNSPQFVKTYDAKPAIERIKQEVACNDAQADKILYASLSIASRLMPIMQIPSMQMLSMQGENPTDVIVDGDRVIVRGDESSHQRVKKELDRIVKHGFTDQVVLDAKFSSIPQSQFSKLPFDWDLTTKTADGALVLLSLLSPAETQSLIEECQNNIGVDILHAPRVTYYSGHEGIIADTVQRPFVVGFNNPAGKETQPEISVVTEGVELTLCPVLEEQFISLRVQDHRSWIAKVDAFSFQAGGKTRTVQVPRVVKQQFQTKMKFPHGDSLAYAMLDVRDGGKVLMVILTATPPSAIEKLAKTGKSANAPLPLADSDTTFYSQPSAAASSDIETKPESRSQGDPILLKADGPRMSEEHTQKLAEAIRLNGWAPHFEGTFEFEIADKKVVLKGKNIALSQEVDGMQITSPSGEIIFDLAEESMLFRADTVLEFAFANSAVKMRGKELLADENGVQVIGTPLRFEIKEYALQGESEKLVFDGDFKISGNVKFQKGDMQLSADKVELFSDSSRLELLGNVNYAHHFPGTEQGSTTVKASMLNLDLKTGGVEFVKASELELPAQEP